MFWYSVHIMRYLREGVKTIILFAKMSIRNFQKLHFSIKILLCFNFLLYGLNSKSFNFLFYGLNNKTKNIMVVDMSASNFNAFLQYIYIYIKTSDKIIISSWIHTIFQFTNHYIWHFQQNNAYMDYHITNKKKLYTTKFNIIELKIIKQNS